MRETTAFEKLLSSIINILCVLIFSLPFLFLDINHNIKKSIIIIMFLLYKIIIIFFNKNRSIGMMITETRWKEPYPLKNQIIHAILYTLSFSTLLFWIFFPFDLFFMNMLFVQAPTLQLKGTTFHGYFAGDMRTVK